MKTHSPLSLLPLLLLAGCASIDQAALIYSSRITGGLDLSASGTESQGVALNIGFKTVDFAYVPVAVAASAAGGTVVTPLGGSSREDLAAAAERALPADGVERVRRYEEAREQARRKQQSVKDLQRNLDAADAAVKPQAQQRLDTAKKELAQAQQALKAAEAQAQDDLEQLQQGLRDAMSVYGSFDGQGLGLFGKEQPKGSLSMGRVFSTGVAAQKLTRAAVIEAQSSCLQRYLAVLEQVSDAAKRAELAGRVNEACKTNEK